MKTKNKQQPKKIIKIIFFNILFVVLLWELSANVYYALTQKSFFYAREKQEIQKSQIPVEYQTKMVVFHPYLGYVNHEGRRDEYACNNHGFQFYRPLIEAKPTAYDYPYQKSDDEVIVGIFGGSVGLGFAVTAQKSETFSKLLSQIPKFKNKKITILNFSLSGFKQPQQLLTLSYYLSLGQKFDVVINIDGFNETVNNFINWKAGLEPTYPADTVWGAMGRAMEQGKIPSKNSEDLLAAYHEKAAAKIAEKNKSTPIASIYMLRKIAEAYHHYRHQSLLSHARGKLEEISWFPAKHRYTFGENINLAEYTADRWMESSILMNRLMCDSGGIYLHVLQPDQWFKKSGDYIPKDPNHPYKWVIDPVNQTYPEFVKRMPQLQKANVNILDATMIFKGNSKVWADDCCHFTDEGYEILFKLIVDHLQKRSEL